MQSKSEYRKSTIELILFYIILIPLQLAGMAMVAVGAFQFAESNSWSPRVRPGAVEGVVVGKFERAVPGRDIMAYGVTVEPDRARGTTVTRWLDQPQWNRIAQGDRWADPAPRSPRKGRQRSTYPGSLKSFAVGFLMLLAVRLLRRRFGMRGDDFDSPAAHDTDRSNAELQRSGKDHATTGKQAAETRKATAPRSTAKRRPATVTRAGWF